VLLERKIHLFGWQSMSYQIGAYILTIILCLLILYAGYYGEGSEKDIKDIFVGVGLKEQENCLGGVA